MGHFRSYQQAKDAIKPIKETIGGKDFHFKPFPSVDYYERFQAWLETQGDTFDFDKIPDTLTRDLFLESMSEDDYAELKKRVSLIEFPLLVRDLLEQTGLVVIQEKEAGEPDPPNREARRKKAKASLSSKPSAKTSARSKQTGSTSTQETSSKTAAPAAQAS